MHHRKKIQSFVSILAIGIISALIVAPVSRADSQQSVERRLSKMTDQEIVLDVVPCGIYRDMNWVRKVKLGVAPFVNPSLLKHYAIAYRYDPVEVFKTVGFNAFKEYSKKGEITLAKFNQNSYTPYYSSDSVYAKVLKGKKVKVFDLRDKLKTLYTSSSEENMGQVKANKFGWAILTNAKKLKHIEGVPIVSWMAVAPENYSAKGKVQSICNLGFLFDKTMNYPK